MRINSKEYDVSEERVFLITEGESRTIVHQSIDPSEVFDSLHERYDTDSEFWPWIRSQRAMEVGTDHFVRQVNLYWDLQSAGNGSVFGRELIPAVRFVDSMECSHKVTREVGDSDVTIKGALVFDNGDAYKWTVVGERHSLEWSKRPKMETLRWR